MSQQPLQLAKISSVFAQKAITISLLKFAKNNISLRRRFLDLKIFIIGVFP